ncbi:MAG: phospho-sugar mutase [Sandaracinaceae bacterium]|nr:phospho-sugar mutase [Sandaracinaceae bacterium]
MHEEERASLLAEAEAWIAEDPSPSDRDELRALIAQNAWEELRERFRERLEFGTAGLRAPLGAGPSRMNLAVVQMATKGLVEVLLRHVPRAQERGLVIGRDGRRGSAEFAKAAASVALGMGMRVHFFEEAVPTPLVSFACTALQASGGVVITASHNPPEYNGYKVYWEDGAQIIPPFDKEVAQAMRAASPSQIPLLDLNEARRSGKLVEVPESIGQAYIHAIEGLLMHRDVGRSLKIAYTALHGVGEKWVRAALKRAGFEHIHSVPEQAEPDGNFPTVTFPNPEEKGAMDMVLALAQRVDAELVLANDPDADRLAVAVRASPSHPRAGEFVVLSGNEVGCLLAHHLLTHAPYRGKHPLIVSSLVSTPWLGPITLAHGAKWEQTLTGFKWIARRLAEGAKAGHTPLLGFEEALGYSIGGVVPDKDGISAALVVADMAAYYASRGLTLLDALDELARRYGLYLSRQISVTQKGQGGIARIQQLMEQARQQKPKCFGKWLIHTICDYEKGKRSFTDGKEETMNLPKANMLSFELDGGHRIMMRPSGTEPKIKFYFDVKAEISNGETVLEARNRAEEMLSDLIQNFFAKIGMNQNAA